MRLSTELNEDKYLTTNLLCFLLQLIIAHGNDGEDQVDKVKRTKEDDEKKEDDVPGAGRPGKNNEVANDEQRK